MNWERLKISAQTTGIRLRARARLLTQLVGIAAVLLGAFNMLVVPAVGVEPVATAYRGLAGVAAVGDRGVVVVADVGLMAAGAVVSWVF
jgi:hypothetical protein